MPGQKGCVFSFLLCFPRRLALLAGADAAEVFEAVDAGAVAVAEVEVDGVVADGLGAQGARGLLVHGQGAADAAGAHALSLGAPPPGGGAGGPLAAGGAGTLLAQVGKGVAALVSVAPLDDDAFARRKQHLDADRFSAGIRHRSPRFALV